MTDYRAIYKEMQNHQYISFDLFDTLIKRSVSAPELVFDLVEIAYNKKHSLPVKDFKMQRVRAEQYARKVKIKEDVTIHDIYQYLQYDDDRRNALKEEEILMEITTCMANEPMVKICQRCMKNGKNVIITTDMYLERETISQILENIGIDNYLFLFISSEIGYTKQSGNLYKHIISTLNIKPAELFHIGDNRKSDYENAIQNGIRAVWLEETNIVPNYWEGVKTDNINTNHMYTFIKNKEILRKTVEYALGYRLVGPVLYNFCFWLHQEVACQKIEKLVFVAREGYLILEIYKNLFPYEADRLKYLRINKNTLRLPILYLDSSIDMFLSLIPNRKEYRIQDIFQFLYIDLNMESAVLLLKKYHYTGDSIVKKTGMYKDANFKAFYKECIEMCFPEIEKQYIFLQQYILENDLNGKVALVNNSINAKVQKCLDMIISNCSMNIKLWGIHFIISEEGMQAINGKCSIWFRNECRDFEKRIFCHYCLIFEHMMFEAEGTALYYTDSGKEIVAVCESHENEAENDIRIRDITEGCIEFQNDYKKKMPLYVGPAFCLRAISHFFLKPEKKDASSIGRLIDYEYGKQFLLDKWGNAKRILNDRTVLFYNMKLYIRLPQKLV